MPASTLQELHDFEGQFATAAKAILTAAGLTGVRGVGETGTVPDEVIVTNFLAGAAVPDARGVLTPSGAVIAGLYDGSLEILIRRRRDDNIASELTGVSRRMNETISQIRALFLAQPEPFTSANLPYYDVSNLIPQETEYAYDTATRREAVVLSWSVRWCINPDQLPADS